MTQLVKDGISSLSNWGFRSRLCEEIGSCSDPDWGFRSICERTEGGFDASDLALFDRQAPVTREARIQYREHERRQRWVFSLVPAQRFD